MGGNSEDAPEVIYEGLNLIKKIIVPHFDNPDFKTEAMQTNQKLLDEDFDSIPLNDSQAILVEDDKVSIL